MKKQILITAALVLGSALAADDWSEISVRHPQFAASEKAFVTGEAEKMRAAGLDAKPLYNKIREGLAKGVPVDALRRAVTRERESYERAAKLVTPLAGISKEQRMALCQAIVISMRRGTTEADLNAAISRPGINSAHLSRMIDVLGDLARSGIHGDAAVKAANEAAGHVSGGGATDRSDGRFDATRSLQQREIRQSLPVNKPIPPPPPRNEPYQQK